MLSRKRYRSQMFSGSEPSSTLERPLRTPVNAFGLRTKPPPIPLPITRIDTRGRMGTSMMRWRCRLSTWIVLGLAIVFGAGCAGSEMASSAPTEDPPPLHAGPGVFGGGVPIEDEPPSTTPPGDPNNPFMKQLELVPVKFKKNSTSLGSCIIGEACDKPISAIGGDGEYVWSLIEGRLPRGLEFSAPVGEETKTARIQQISGQEIDEIGEFSFTLKVADATDEENAAEKRFTLNVNEYIAMLLHTLTVDGNGDRTWVTVEEKDADGYAVPVVVPPKGVLLVQVMGHAASYTWSINGREIACDDNACTGTQDGFTLFKDTNLEPSDIPGNHMTMVLKADEGFFGQERMNVVIAASDAFGNTASKVISSITFEQDPCKTPLTVTGGGTVTADASGNYSVAITVSGGQAPYYSRTRKTMKVFGFRQEAIFPWRPLLSPAISIDGEVDLKGKRIKKLSDGTLAEARIDIKDSCPTPNAATKSYSVKARFDPRTIDRVSNLRIKMDVRDVNDTSFEGAYGDDTTYLVIKVKAEGEEIGRFYYDLDECGDSGEESACENIRRITMGDNGDPLITEIDEIILQFHDDECIGCGDLDCDIITIDFMTDHWTTRYYDDTDEGGYGHNDDVVDDEWGPKRDLIPKIKNHDGVSSTKGIWKYKGDE